MNEIVIARPDEGPLKAELVPAVARARELSVTTQDEHAVALTFIGELGRVAKKVEALFAEPKRAAHAAHKAITAAETALLDPIKHAKGIVSGKCDEYEREQRRIAAEAARLAEQEARRQEEERKLAEAQAAQDAGDAGLADAIMDEPIEVPVIAPAPAVAVVAGVSTSQRWSAEVIDKMALIRYVAEHPEWASLLDANTPNLNRLAVSQRSEMRLPGVRAVSTTVRAVRAS